MSLDNSPSPVEEGDIIYDIDNDRTFLVESKVEYPAYVGISRCWRLLCLNEGWSEIFSEQGMNRNFEVGFWRLKNP